MALDKLRLAHLNVAAFTKTEMQLHILKQLGRKFNMVNLVETHTKPRTEIEIKKKFPGIEFYFNHGPPQLNKEDKREACRGTLIAFQEGLIKVDNFQIIIEGRLSVLDFQIEERPYRFISVYAPAEPETRNSVDFFKKLFTTDILDPSKTNILAGDWNCGLHQSDHHGYKDWESYRFRTRRIIKKRLH